MSLIKGVCVLNNPVVFRFYLKYLHDTVYHKTKAKHHLRSTIATRQGGKNIAFRQILDKVIR